MRFFKKLDRKGFTLAEMLIVLAVVTVLAAAVLPTVGQQVEAAREANDLSKAANAYTEAYTEASIYYAGGATDDKTVTKAVAFEQSDKTGWVLTNHKVGGEDCPAGGITAFVFSAQDGGAKLSSISAASS